MLQWVPGDTILQIMVYICSGPGENAENLKISYHRDHEEKNGGGAFLRKALLILDSIPCLVPLRPDSVHKTTSEETQWSYPQKLGLVSEWHETS